MLMLLSSSCHKICHNLIVSLLYVVIYHIWQTFYKSDFELFLLLQVLKHALRWVPVHFETCSFRILCRALWRGFVCPCLFSCSFQEGGSWPAGSAGLAGLSPRSPGSAGLLSPAAVPASAAPGRPPPAAAARAALRSTQQNNRVQRACKTDHKGQLNRKYSTVLGDVTLVLLCKTNF